MIVVLIDHDAGTLGFRVEYRDTSRAKRNKPSRKNKKKMSEVTDEGRTIQALEGFPPGAQFRPWVTMGTAGDQLSFYGSLSRPV